MSTVTNITIFCDYCNGHEGAAPSNVTAAQELKPNYYA